MDQNDHTLKVLVFAASLRTGSHNRQLASIAAKALERAGAAVDLASMAEFDVLLYDGDVEASTGIPVGAQEFQRRLLANDAFVIASPEYNASMPGTLKNLIDWTSRFKPQPFDGKHCLLISASPSLVGGNRGLWSLRIPLEHLGTRVFPDMFSLASSHTKLTDEAIADETLQRRFEATCEAFVSLAEAARNYPCMKRKWVEFLSEPPKVAAEA